MISFRALTQADARENVASNVYSQLPASMLPASYKSVTVYINNYESIFIIHNRKPKLGTGAPQNLSSLLFVSS